MSRNSIKNIIAKTTSNSGLPAEKSTQNNITTILDALSVGKNVITIDEDLVEILGASGVTVKNACSLLHKSFQYFDENPTMLEAFNRGRATLGSKVRSKLIEAALEGNNIQSAIHLDKIYSGDTLATEINLNVQSQLSTVSDEELMKVAFTVDTNVEGLEESFDTVETNGDLGGSETLGGGGHTLEE